MAHLPLHGIETKAQRLYTLAHEVSLAGGHRRAWIWPTMRIHPAVAAIPAATASVTFPNSMKPRRQYSRMSRPGQV